MARYWTCRKCRTANPRLAQRCPTCATKRPAPRKSATRAVLDRPYDEWAERFGETCGICGRVPTARRLHRDHDHRTGRGRGLLCFRCNAALRQYMTSDWLRQAIVYLESSPGDDWP